MDPRDALILGVAVVVVLLLGAAMGVVLYYVGNRGTPIDDD
jgi:hypothetical protein